MPVVKTIDNRVQRDSAPKVRDTVRVSSDTFGIADDLGKAAKSIQDIGVMAAKQYQEEKKKADQVRVEQADNTFSSSVRDYLYNENTGATNRKGENALGVSGETNDFLDKKQKEIEDTLEDDQKAAFKAKVFSTREAALKSASTHESAQNEVFQKNIYGSSITNAREDAINSFNDESIINLSIEKQARSTIDYAKRNGLGEDWVEAELTNSVSKTHDGVITRMLNGGADQQAKAYYEKYGQQITGDEKIKVEKMLKEGSLKGESQRTSDAIVNKTDDLQVALSKARNISDPELRDATIERVKQTFTDRDAARNYNSNQAFERAYIAVESNRNYDAIPADLLNRLDAKDKETLKKIASSSAVETDMKTYNDLMLMASNPKLKQSFLQTSILKYSDKLAKPEMKELIKLQNDLRSGKKEAADSVNVYARQQDLITTTLNSVGLEKSSKSDTKQKQINRFYVQMDTAMKQKEAELGRKPNIQEFQQVLDGLVIQVVTDKGTFYDTKKRSFEVGIEDVPAEERAKISDALKRAGTNPSETNIINLYLKKQNK